MRYLLGLAPVVCVTVSGGGLADAARARQGPD